MQAIVIRLSDLTFLSSEDLSGACSQAELGEKIIKQFAFLTGDIRVTISDAGRLAGLVIEGDAC